MREIKDLGVKIVLDKERHLKFNFNTLVDLEEKYGSVDKMGEVLASNPKMKDIRYILYCTLKHEDKTLTEEKTGEIISLNQIRDITDKLTEALSESMPEVDEEENEKN